MEKFFFVVVFALASFFAAAQDSTKSVSTNRYKYFIATNSGIFSTPVGFRVGFADRMGWYVGLRFGSGHKYEEDFAKNVEESEATLFAANAGLIFPIATRRSFKVHTLFGIGYGKWFDRLSKNGQTVGLEVEGGLLFSYRRFLVTTSGVLLTGDGKPAKSDLTVGIGLKF